MAEIGEEEIVSTSPVQEYTWKVLDSGNSQYLNKVLIGTAVTGLVRVEWVQARYGQIIPPNWSQIEIMSFLNSYVPLRFQIPDAQNLIVQEAIEKEFIWVLLLEHDVLLPPDGFIKFNEYMKDPENPIAPVVSGLYYQRWIPSEPMVYRGIGTGAFIKWKLGDLIWCSGVPTGALLIHTSILKAMWDDSEEYVVRGRNIRRVFKQPCANEFDPEAMMWNSETGTTDLNWCKRIIENGYLKKAGWGDFAKKHPKYPFLCDTKIACRHINPDGEVFPHG